MPKYHRCPPQRLPGITQQHARLKFLQNNFMFDIQRMPNYLKYPLKNRPWFVKRELPNVLPADYKRKHQIRNPLNPQKQRDVRLWADPDRQSENQGLF